MSGTGIVVMPIDFEKKNGTMGSGRGAKLPIATVEILGILDRA